ncbi:MAG: ATP-binding protein, partial [Psychromonas sp.]
MKLIHKFFLAFFITNITLVGVMFVFIYLNFTTEFNHFVEKQEQKHFSEVKQQLTQFYAKANSWETIAYNNQLWRSIVEPQQKNNKNNTSLDNSPPSLLWLQLPGNLLKTGRRISLYNQQKNVIIGREKIDENPLIEPILVNNKVVGWMGLVPSKLSANSPAEAFLNAQLHNYIIITLLVIMLACLMAVLLSKHLTNPIQKIVVATNELNKGNFNSRITLLSQDELGTLSNNFNELANTLQENQQMRFQWVSDTSHELRTPLTVLRSHLIAVQDGVFVADNKRISLLLDQVNNLNLIVDDLSQLAHSDTASLHYHFKALDIAKLLQHTLSSYSARFTQCKLNVAPLNIDSAVNYQVYGDQERLQQLFINLLENVCRYTNQGGQLNIYLKQVNQYIELSFADSAPGVNKQEQEKLFDRFYRVEKSRSREHGGTGLGLALCQQITQAHKGRISLQDSPLGGLQVTLTLP